MSAYRRRTCRTITFQHPTYAVFQSSPINSITNGMSSSDNDAPDELMINANAGNDNHNATTGMATCNDLNHNNNVSANSSSDDQQVQLVNSNTTNFPSQPKHVRFPDVPYHSELLNELMMFAYTIIAAAMQFMHLYRTVWWLPESNTNQTMVSYPSELNRIKDFIFGYNFSYFLFFVAEFLLDWHAFNHVYCDIIRTSICLLFFNKNVGVGVSAAFSSNGTENHQVCTPINNNRKQSNKRSGFIADIHFSLAFYLHSVSYA